MFQMLIHPSSGTCDYLVRCCVGWLEACWCYVAGLAVGAVVSECRLNQLNLSFGFPHKKNPYIKIYIYLLPCTWNTPQTYNFLRASIICETRNYKPCVLVTVTRNQLIFLQDVQSPHPPTNTEPSENDGAIYQIAIPSTYIALLRRRLVMKAGQWIATYCTYVTMETHEGTSVKCITINIETLWNYYRTHLCMSTCFIPSTIWSLKWLECRWGKL